MTIIIWKKTQTVGTSLSRYKSRRAAKLALQREEERLARKVACLLSGCSQRVQSAVRESSRAKIL
ncbi:MULTISPECIES: hypothetical protein [unclassified Erwinia]|uniref:hypothetical protein n=1 Tax=unclassified Erwinia TaxID=2622719 RepID=UPI0008333FB1|nr:hypothetical protein [Erwinia sp. ErVv1]